MEHKSADVELINSSDEIGLLAIQGPQAAKVMSKIIDYDLDTLGFYSWAKTNLFGEETLFSRTGYTGEDGFEIMLPEEQAADFWNALKENGVQPCGLGSRDTLRLEAGMNLYGSDMDESVSPLVSGLNWTVGWSPEDRDFIGRAALQRERDAGPKQRFVGLLLEDKGILRNHQKVRVEGATDGEITSGSFSPTLGRSIALARVPTQTGERCQVEVRGRLLAARVVKPPFVRNGKAQVE